MKEISSQSNSELKNLRQLCESSRARKERGCFVIEGEQLIIEAIRSGVSISSLFVSKHYDVHEDLTKFFDVTRVVIGHAANKLGDTVSGQPVVAVGEIPQQKNIRQNDTLLVVADGISDPGNLGTLIRSANGFDADAVILTSDCADPWSPKVVRSSAGAIFSIPIIAHQPIRDVLKQIKEFQYEIWLADANGESLYELSKPEKLAIVIGNEANGISESVKEFGDTSVSIPISNKIESLNAAVAASVILGELARCRKHHKD